MSAVHHLHRYERKFLGKKGTYRVFACNMPNCTHYLRDTLVLGKECLCNRCGETMIMTKRAMQLEKPHCVDCIKTRRKINDGIKSFLEAQDKSIKRSIRDIYDELEDKETGEKGKS